MYNISRDVEEEEEGDGDEDWIEPGKINNRRKRDKNSPKRCVTFQSYLSIGTLILSDL